MKLLFCQKYQSQRLKKYLLEQPKTQNLKPCDSWYIFRGIHLVIWKTGLYQQKNPPSEEGGLNEAELRLISLYRELNQEGQEKLLDLADDIVSSGKYIKSDSSKLGKAKGA